MCHKIHLVTHCRSFFSITTMLRKTSQCAIRYILQMNQNKRRETEQRILLQETRKRVLSSDPPANQTSFSHRAGLLKDKGDLGVPSLCALGTRHGILLLL